VTIQGSTGMDSAEVDKLVKEAEAKREEDKNKKESIEARNIAESSIYQAEKTLSDNKDKIGEDDKNIAEEKIKELKEILIKIDISKDEINEKAKNLSDIMMKIGQSIYSNSQNENNQTQSPNDVVD
jgi:molecular chaperone DnaK